MTVTEAACPQLNLHPIDATGQVATARKELIEAVICLRGGQESRDPCDHRFVFIRRWRDFPRDSGFFNNAPTPSRSLEDQRVDIGIPKRLLFLDFGTIFSMVWSQMYSVAAPPHLWPEA
jgi:hypothetical protein